MGVSYLGASYFWVSYLGIVRESCITIVCGLLDVNKPTITIMNPIPMKGNPIMAPMRVNVI